MYNYDLLNSCKHKKEIPNLITIIVLYGIIQTCAEPSAIYELVLFMFFMKITHSYFIPYEVLFQNVKNKEPLQDLNQLTFYRPNYFIFLYFFLDNFIQIFDSINFKSAYKKASKNIFNLSKFLTLLPAILISML